MNSGSPCYGGVGSGGDDGSNGGVGSGGRSGSFLPQVPTSSPQRLAQCGTYHMKMKPSPRRASTIKHTIPLPGMNQIEVNHVVYLSCGVIHTLISMPQHRPRPHHLVNIMMGLMMLTKSTPRGLGQKNMSNGKEVLALIHHLMHHWDIVLDTTVMVVVIVTIVILVENIGSTHTIISHLEGIIPTMATITATILLYNSTHTITIIIPITTNTNHN